MKTSLNWRFSAAAIGLGTMVFTVTGCATNDNSGGSTAASTVAATDDVPLVREGEYTFPTSLGEAGAFAVFEPKPNGRTSQIDYSVLSEALDIMVFNTGPSLRVVAKPRLPSTGTRQVRGHTSPLRLEGNKIFFSQFDRDTVAAFTDYKDSLVDIGNRVDITTLSRNEQLAYWFNLHNVLVIESIATNYPVQYPNRLRFGADKVLRDDAKLITIRGVALSLADIRRNVVYRYWDDPRVMYGFFHGDLGSPNINDEAFTGDNVNSMLNGNASEFVNSLRGVQEGASTIYVSKHYLEARPGLFSEWPDDLIRHLRAFAQADVQMILERKSDLGFTGAQYEDRTADLVGGDPRLDTRAGPTTVLTSPQLQEFAAETSEKLLELRRQGKLRSRVIIIDLPDGEDDIPEEKADGEID